LNQYIIEASSGQYDYVKALAEFSSRDESALNFKKGDIIAVVPKHDAYTEKVSSSRKLNIVGFPKIHNDKKFPKTYKDIDRISKTLKEKRFPKN
jgi:hypothetical protein